MVDVSRDDTYLTFSSYNTQRRLSGVRQNQTQPQQQPGTSCACSGMASHSSANFFLKSANIERRLLGHSILTISRYWCLGQIHPLLSGVVQGISQVDPLYQVIFQSASHLYSLLSVALKKAVTDLTNFSEDQSTTACSARDGSSSWRTGPRLWTVKIPFCKVSSQCLSALRLHQGAVISAAFSASSSLTL